MSCVLITSGDEATCKAIGQFLVFQGHFALSANDLHALMNVLKQWQVDALILDVVGQQDKERETWRALQSPVLRDTPVIFLTWAWANAQKLLRPGQDDFLVKPVNLGHLEQKLWRALGKSQTSFRQRSGRSLRCGSISLDPATFQVTVGGRHVSPTPIEFSILHQLMSRAGNTVSIGGLIEAVWHYPQKLGSPELVRVHVKNLRRKLGDNGRGDSRFIKTVPRQGYLIPVEPSASSILGAA